ncbi:hypothetical protein GQ53DRAFT_773130 [Thozetella sp. PMI_491]|nr:hypothetical protein GQ53DRAFT_773130 [Thozetella sp. PMI_491]
MSYYNARQVPTYYADVNTTAPPAGMGVPAYDPYAVAPLTIPPTNPGPLPAQHRASSGAWTVQDDNTLLAARASGQNWSQIQAQYFPGKTGNACRKRHERLMERKGADDWDTRKLERLSKEYMSMRKEIWAPLAAKTGEKWNVVEQKCMSNGLKNIQLHARAYARKERLGSGLPLPPYDDDSGVSVVGMPDIDDGPEDAYSSPESTHSHSGSGSSTAGQPSYGSVMHSQDSYQGYNYGQSHHSYTSSVSSNGAAGYVQASHGSQSTSPYMSHPNRLPSVSNIGIDHIINRAPHNGM